MAMQKMHRVKTTKVLQERHNTLKHGGGRVIGQQVKRWPMHVLYSRQTYSLMM